ncbi:MAG: HAMP domain-containing sensor histidine kinase [Niameybacter sp.]|uniref:sensor histidine kinase n=1 Tax=Niameybacter sp. TaxID=2033640 RepID=UPI002FC82F77
MLRKLRLQLTLLSSSITASILIVMAILSLMLFEDQLNKQSHTAFSGYLNLITSKLQNDRVISQTWLAQMEATHHLVIFIEDNGTPLLFQGAFHPRSSRSSLIEMAQRTARHQYNFDPHAIPLSKLDVPTVTFSLTPSAKEHFLTGIAIVPSLNGAYTVTLLQDMQFEHTRISQTRLLFGGLVLCSVGLLAYFCWWFAGRAMIPIEKSKRKQVEFIAAASHELRAPLAAVQASVSVLSPTNIASNEHFISAIHGECKRMSHLVDDLLLLANADAETWSIHYSPVECDTLLIETLELFYPLAKAQGLLLGLELPNTIVPSITADANRIKQAITVLIDNAIHYTPSKGSIMASLSLEERHLTIKVIDNGPGIPDIHKPYIFDRFYRVDPSRHEKNHYDLGLSIAYEIIHLHGGRLSLEDTPQGGCTFIIKLSLTHSMKN